MGKSFPDPTMGQVKSGLFLVCPEGSSGAFNEITFQSAFVEQQQTARNVNVFPRRVTFRRSLRRCRQCLREFPFHAWVKRRSKNNHRFRLRTNFLEIDFYILLSIFCSSDYSIFRMNKTRRCSRSFENREKYRVSLKVFSKAFPQ